MKQFLLLLLAGMMFAPVADAQTRYMVKFKNKGGTPYTFTNPLAYLSQRAIDRRTKYGIAIDSTDLPVTPSYVTQVKNVPNVTILNTSKWLNSVSILVTDPAAITTINGFSFVQALNPIGVRQSAGNGKEKFEIAFTPLNPINTQRINGDYYDYGMNGYTEIHLQNGEFLHNIGLRGQGMQIAMLDGGFQNYTNLKAFDSVNTNGQILSTWDFVARHASVVEDHIHGMQCLSTIAANIPGQWVGKAPKASFHLFRTEETANEYPIEEHNWVCGAERADSIGSDIISSSVGYSDFDDPAYDHTYAQMNGNTAMATIGADLAAKKGLLVFVAAGNTGLGSWHYIISPADADSVVTVGSVTNAGIVAGSSAYGPSSDGQIKPDVAAVGEGAVVQAANNTIGLNSGTSFACPNMAGLATCLWQGFPEYNNMKIVEALRQAGSITATPNDRIGYGIPNMKLAFTNLLTEYATSTATLSNCVVTVNWNTKDVSAMKFEIERKAPGELTYTKIADVNPLAGTVLANHSYQYNNTLTNGLTGTFSYRIRQVVDTATASFTAVYIDTANVVVSAGCFPTGTGNPAANAELVSIQPNPVTGTNVTLVVETPYAVSKMPVTIHDNKGRLVAQWQFSKTTGRFTTDLPVGKLPAGTYYIKVWNDRKQVGTVEMVKL
jgi:serine protease AprX